MRRIPSLDGLRAISIVAVIICHLPVNEQSIAGHFFRLLAVGVQLFFVISGYLITSLLLSETEKTGTVKLQRFYFRRALRIFPPYYAYLVFLLIMALAAPFRPIERMQFLYALPFVALYISNYRFDPNVMTGHTWSLSLEEQFYLFWPVTLRRLGAKRASKLLVAAIIFCPIYRLAFRLIVHKHLLPYSTGDYSGSYLVTGTFEGAIDLIAAGCLLAICRDKWRENRLYLWFVDSRGYAFICAAGLVTFFIGYPHGGPFEITWMTFGKTVLSVLFVATVDRYATHSDYRFAQFLNWRPMAFIGKISYSIYIWHAILLFNPFGWSFLRFPVGLFLILPVSLASYYLVELPTLRLRERIERKRLPLAVTATGD